MRIQCFPDDCSSTTEADAPPLDFRKLCITSVIIAEKRARNLNLHINMLCARAEWTLPEKTNEHSKTFSPPTYFFDPSTIMNIANANKFLKKDVLPSPKLDVVDMIKIDVYQCKTGELVCPEVETLADGTPISQSSYTRLHREIPHAPKLPGSLNKIDQRYTIIFQLNTKNTVDTFWNFVTDLVTSGARDPSKIIISSFDHQDLVTLANMKNNTNLASVKTAAVINATPIGYMKTLRIHNVSFLLTHGNRITPALIEDAHIEGIQVIAFNVHHPSMIQKCISCRVDGIISELPNIVEKAIENTEKTQKTHPLVSEIPHYSFFRYIYGSEVQSARKNLLSYIKQLAEEGKKDNRPHVLSRKFSETLGQVEWRVAMCLEPYLLSKEGLQKLFLLTQSTQANRTRLKLLQDNQYCLFDFEKQWLQSANFTTRN